MRPCIIVPAFEAERTLRSVLDGLQTNGAVPIYVIDDGSSDDTANAARELGVRVAKHDYNRGKGSALRTGMHLALDDGYDVCVTVDADGQHPPAAVKRILEADADPA